jgi:hypothetical protein
MAAISEFTFRDDRRRFDTGAPSGAMAPTR